MPRAARIILPLLPLVFRPLAAQEASDSQSALRAASPQAAGIETLWWIMLAVSVLVFLLVIASLAGGLWRGRQGRGGLGEQASRRLVISAGLALPLATAIALIGGSLWLGRDLTASAPDGALRVEITGWRWWWEIRYLDENGDTIATTANELHVPVGRPVSLELSSGDVIHSFWVPQLHGKTDLIPGQTNRSWFVAGEAGRFRGQCAEFCGVQHALMAFLVIAEPEEDFRAWLRRQSRPAQPPEGALEQQGMQVFLDAACDSCHAIRGLSSGPLGPDLTHFASRQTLAAATEPNTPGHLGGWISDPQSIKPGALMPATLMAGDELRALIAYLMSLE